MMDPCEGSKQPFLFASTTRPKQPQLGEMIAALCYSWMFLSSPFKQIIISAFVDPGTDEHDILRCDKCGADWVIPLSNRGPQRRHAQNAPVERTVWAPWLRCGRSGRV
jgi:hypothetical protein